jgi:hypothetical protein
MSNNMIRHAWIIVFVCSAISGPAFAIQKETSAEKAENLEKQVKGGLFNFWNFDTQAPETTPDGFAAITVGEGPGATWSVEAEPTAPSRPNSVLSTSACAECIQLLIAQGFNYEYPDLSVRLSQTDGHGRSGVVFGVKDRMNFYAAVVDLSRNTLQVIRVVAGTESVVGQAALKSKPVDWHTMRVQRNTIISKDFIETFFDGLGQIGLLVRGTTSARFDNFHAAPLYSHRPFSAPAAY